jgi:enamine deaminase RidA (YjgF/YER057c/UK114 family)
MPKTMHVVNPPTLAKPSGYSHAWDVTGGRTLYISGQVARDRDGRVVGPDDIAAQFRQVCENLKQVLLARAAHMSDLVKLTIYVLDVGGYKAHLKEIGAVYREYFGKHFPAMTLVGVRDLFDAADGCLIEVEGVAVLD